LKLTGLYKRELSHGGVTV